LNYSIPNAGKFVPASISIFRIIIIAMAKYSPGEQIEKNEMGGALPRMGDRRGTYRVLVGRPEGRNHLEDPDVDGTIY
jgi:hypothetical protein